MPSGKPPKAQGRKCGSLKTDGSGERCQQPAGAGTDHVGWGKCKFHGGNSPSLKTAAAREEAAAAIAALGAPVEIDAEKALLQELWRTQGHVEWLREQIAELSQGDMIYLTDQGFKPRAFLDVYQKEREHLAKVSKWVMEAGIDERLTRLAEAQGEMLAEVIRRILGDDELALTPEQRRAAGPVVRRHLSSVPGAA